MRQLISAITATLLLCGCYDSFKAPQTDTALPEANISIAALHRLCDGPARLITEDMIIAGRVSSDDAQGNFYRTFTIADHSGGAEILAGIADIRNIYPEGCRIAVRLRGCAIDEQDGVLRIGLPAEPNDYDTLLEMQAPEVLDLHIVRGDDIETVVPYSLTADRLTLDMCGLPVMVAGLRHTAVEGEAGVWEGLVRFEDAEGNPVYTQTSSYADFAQQALPGGETAIAGILLYGTVSREEGKHFMLKMRRIEDCSNHN